MHAWARTFVSHLLITSKVKPGGITDVLTVLLVTKPRSVTSNT